MARLALRPDFRREALLEVREPSLPRIPEGFAEDVCISRSLARGRQLQTNIPRLVVQHSPDGFECGYSGSGRADLALNILNAFVPPRAERPKAFCESERDDDPIRMVRGVASRFAMRWHQRFKLQFIATMNRNGGQMSAPLIHSWIEAQRALK